MLQRIFSFGIVITLVSSLCGCGNKPTPTVSRSATPEDIAKAIAEVMCNEARQDIFQYYSPDRLISTAEEHASWFFPYTQMDRQTFIDRAEILEQDKNAAYDQIKTHFDAFGVTDGDLPDDADHLAFTTGLLSIIKGVERPDEAGSDVVSVKRLPNEDGMAVFRVTLLKAGQASSEEQNYLLHLESVNNVWYFSNWSNQMAAQRRKTHEVNDLAGDH